MSAVLAVIGLVGTMAMIRSLVPGLDFWAEDNGDRLVSLAFFVVVALGAVGS